MTKRCSMCKQEKTLGEFPRNPRTRLGVGSYCKPCLVNYMTARRKAGLENPVTRAWIEYTFNARLGRKRVKRDAPHRVFALPRDLFDDLVTDNCFYCGAQPDPVNGIDRVDNSKGYLPDNVVTACRACNRAKFTMERGEFEAWAVRLGRNLARFAPAA